MIDRQEVPEPLRPYLERPSLYAPGDPLFWDDPHISKGMLEAHLDETNDLASYQPEKREAICDWIARESNISTGSKVLDLGCGPGHYTMLWAEKGCEVSGVDLSPRSIEAAKERAAKKELNIDYRVGDYCESDLGGPFDLITMVSCDFGVLMPFTRVNLAEKIAQALGPGGTFAFDVLSEAHVGDLDFEPQFESLERGFWSPAPHHALTQTWLYDSHMCKLNQFAILSNDGDVRAFRRWEQLYSPETIAQELAASDLEVIWTGDDLSGAPYSGLSPTLGVLARPQRRSEVLTFPRG